MADATACMQALVAQHSVLRDELIHNFSSTNELFGIAVTATAAVLGYAIQKENKDWRLFLLPLAILVPVMWLTLAQFESTLRIATYIQVFLEPGHRPLSWESDLLELRKNTAGADRRFTLSISSAYFVLGLVSAVLSWRYARADVFQRKRRGAWIVGALLLLLYPALIMSSVLESAKFDDYRGNWQVIKNLNPTSSVSCMR